MPRHRLHTGPVVGTLVTVLAIVLCLPGAAWADAERRPADSVTDVALGLGCELVGEVLRCVHDDDVRPPVAAGGGSATEAPVALSCAGDGRSDNRLQVVYAHQADRPDRFASVLPELRRHVDVANGVFSRSSDGSRQLRAVTDDQCRLAVDRVSLPPAQAASFAETTKALRARGHDRDDRKYLVFLDNDRACGLAEQYLDDRAVVDNRNNRGDTYAVVYAPCWGGVLVAHELVHMFGGVQPSAPRSTGSYGHCTDRHDVMCYADGSGKQMTARCPSDHATLLDCGRDDYFAVAPPAGSYLASYWNTAVNSFLVGGSPGIPVAPSAPVNVSSQQAGDDVQLRWEEPGAAGGGVEAFDVVDLAASDEVLASVPGDAGSSTVTLTPWRAYRLGVVARNDAGRSAAAGGLEHMVGRPPGPPSRVAAAYALEALDVRVRLVWTASAHATSYAVYRDGAAVGTSTTTSWTERAPLEVGRTYTYTVHASNAWGSSAQSASASALGVWPASDEGEPTTQPVAVPRAIDDSCPAGSIGEHGFTDVASSSPHEASIDCVAQWRITKGTSPGHFSPHELVSRGQMAAFVGRMITEAGGTLPQPRRDHFDDDDDSPHEVWINSLAEVSILGGKAAGRYEPHAPVSRAQMAKLLTRAYEYRATQHDRETAPQTGARRLPEGADYFVDDDGLVLEPDINKAAAAGFTGGFGDYTYRPHDGVRRDHMASFLARVLDLIVESGMSTVPQQETAAG